MKRFAITIAAGTAVTAFTFGLSGCAGLNTAAKNDFEIDQAKVASVERAASRFGIQVVWVNPPVKRVATPGS